MKGSLDLLGPCGAYHCSAKEQKWLLQLSAQISLAKILSLLGVKDMQFAPQHSVTVMAKGLY